MLSVHISIAEYNILLGHRLGHAIPLCNLDSVLSLSKICRGLGLGIEMQLQYELIYEECKDWPEVVHKPT